MANLDNNEIRSDELRIQLDVIVGVLMDCEGVCQVFNDYFKTGYTLGDALDRDLFSMYSQSELSDEDYDYIEEVIKSIGFELGKRFFPYSEIISDDDLNILSNYLDEKSCSCSQVSLLKVYEDLYEPVFIKTMIEQNNYTSIKKVLDHYYPNKYRIVDNLIIFSDNNSSEHELSRLLKRKGTALSIDCIQSEIKSLSSDEIYQLLSKDTNSLGIVKVDSKSYNHIDNFHLNDLFHGILKSTLSDSFTSSEMIDIDYLYSEINTRLGESNYLSVTYDINSPYCLGNLIVYYYPNLIFANGFIKKNQNKRLVDQIMDDFLQHDVINSNLFDHVMRKYKRQQWGYFENILRYYVRIDKDTFIRNGMITFDVKTIDSCLDHFLSRGYCAITTISTFSIFPTVGYPWNIYLLFSYLYSFSERFTIIPPIQGISRDFHGIIVFKNTYSSFNQVCAKCLVDAGFSNDQLNDESAVGEYLKKMGFISRVRGSFGTIVSIAKAMEVDENV